MRLREYILFFFLIEDFKTCMLMNVELRIIKVIEVNLCSAGVKLVNYIPF